ncbi:MAG TPA: cell division protein FtsW, partial [Paraburkholderia sp.]
MSWSERFGSRLAGQRGSAGGAAASGRVPAGGLASAVNGVRPLRSRMLDYDHSLLWVVVALLGLGVVMVYSASIAMPDSPKYASYRDYAFLARQMLFVVLGSVIGVAAFR